MPKRPLRVIVGLHPALHDATGRDHSIAVPLAARFRQLAAQLPADQKRALALLDGLGSSLDRYVGSAAGAEGIAGRLLLLRQLEMAGLVRYALGRGKAVRAVAEPLNARFQWHAVKLDRAKSLSLSPRAILRPEEDRWVLEAPLGNVRVGLMRRDCVAIVACLAQPRSLQAILQELSAIDAAFVEALVQFLVSAGAVVAGETPPPALRHWRWPDLYFHRHTRLGLMPERIGATGRKPSASPSIVAAAPHAAAPIALAPAAPMDASLAQALARRISIRQPGSKPLDTARLSAFLFHSLRPAPHDTGGHWPYPRMGGLDVFAFHVVVRDCAGLAPGAYAYRPGPHDLLPLNVPRAHVDATMKQASFALGDGGAPPQVVIRMVVDFAGLNQAYDGIAYRLALLTAGTIMQTMYLVATALDLAPCAIGTGDSSSFAALHGLDELERDAIAEFALSSRPLPSRKSVSGSSGRPSGSRRAPR